METDFTAGSAIINRVVEYGQDAVTIVDSVRVHHTQRLTWNFIFAPGIALEQIDGRWHIYFADTTILILESDLALTAYDSWYAPSYGIKVKTIALRADNCVDTKREYRSRLRVK